MRTETLKQIQVGAHLFERYLPDNPHAEEMKCKNCDFIIEPVFSEQEGIQKIKDLHGNENICNGNRLKLNNGAAPISDGKMILITDSDPNNAFKYMNGFDVLILQLLAKSKWGDGKITIAEISEDVGIDNIDVVLSLQRISQEIDSIDMIDFIKKIH